ncbi:MAG: rhodanese-like domain-containing protein [Cryomorphaceae bacterium]|nr:rhodanese-like domain-containing protein [Cryomorphaceae bacterium]
MFTIIKNSVLSISFVFLATSCNAQSTKSGYEDKKVEDVIEMSEQRNVVMIDVRTPGEVANGYLKGTDHFFDISSPNFSKNIDQLDRNKTYVLICASGARSQKAARYMLEQGFGNVVNMSGGMRMVRNADYISR